MLQAVKQLPPHPFAAMFPLREGEALAELAKSIAEHGQQEEIVLYQGKVLDGRRRQIAALRARKKPLYREFGTRAGDGFDPLNFTFNANYHRRDLTNAEKVLAAAKFANMKRGYNHQNHKADSANGAPPMSQKQAAKKLGVPHKQVARAKAVLEKGTPELQEAVRTEAVSISDAAAIAGEEPKVQSEALAAVKNGKASTLKGAVEKIKGPPAEDPGRICRDLELLIDRIGRVQAKDAKAREARDLACESIKTARSFMRRLLCVGAAA